MSNSVISTYYTPPSDPIEIIHEDHEIVVVNKPAGLLSVPGRGPDLADCLITRLQIIFPQVLLVHRLDRDTSGVMVFAMTPHAQKHLSRQFEQRKTSKTYVARVKGRVCESHGTIDLPLIVDWPNRPRQKVCHDTGKPARTDWRVQKASDNESRLRLSPHTGRSHQLRVHMQALGHPILGDPFYADGDARDAYPRMMLHSQELRIQHPESLKGLRFRSKAPF